MSKRELERQVEKNMISNADDLVGRKIVAAYKDYDGLYLMLESDQFCIIGAERDYDTIEVHFATDVCRFDHFDGLVRLGVMTQEQVDEDREARRRESELFKVEQQRREYEKLKKLFDDK